MTRGDGSSAMPAAGYSGGNLSGAECGAFDVPIAFVIFNRPDVTARVFAAIAKQRPRQLFVIADGARPERDGEAERVRQTRAITDAIDWPCEVHRNYAEHNMGCKRRVASGIGWVFEHVDRAVILEDDCLPSPGFFAFCRDMLARYEHDERVFSISGSNFGNDRGENGHYFSRYALMWGWATWRSRWQHYQLEPADYFGVLLRTWWQRPVVFSYWLLIYRRLVSGAIDTWDFQWILTLWRHDALACRPSRNLVQNLGFGADATHTLAADNPLARLPTADATDSFDKCLTDIRPDRHRDRVDEERWALIGIRSVLLMSFPWMGRLKAALS